jgi:hypothetical protein
VTDLLTCERVGESGLVERYIAGRLSDATELTGFEAHLVACPRCQDELRLGLAVRAALASPRARRAPWRWLGAGVAIAASIGTLLLFRSRGPESRDGAPAAGPYRGPAGNLPVAPRPIAPNGPGGMPSRFIWSSVRGTDRYRVVVFEHDGTVRWEAQTPDTAIAPPDSVSLLPSVGYSWKVWARAGWDRWTASELIEFSVRGPSR